eukprot:COSAG01_NODE_57999_length_308_cov_10.521531_1_plen_66_part_01
MVRILRYGPFPPGAPRGTYGGIQLYQYVLYTFRFVGPAETVLDPVFGADHDARISSGQGRRQLAAF